MDQRIVRTLSSFITRSSDYALARLEFAMHHPERAAPPVLESLPDASEQTLRDRWATLEQQLDDIMLFLRSCEDAADRMSREDATYAWLSRLIRELDQYGRALRWVLTVTDRTDT